MDIYFLDNLAAKKTSFLHTMNANLKMVIFALLLMLIIFTDNFNTLLFLYVFLLLIIVLAKMPLGRLLLFSLYPVVFVFIFAISSPEFFHVIILRVVGSSILTVLLVSSTPYFEIFKTLSLILPKIIVQIMFITHRSVYIILHMLSVMMSTLKLRGGGINFKKPLKSIQLMAKSFGYLLVRSADMSERMNDIIYLRGLDL